jgi:signal peptidase I
VSDTKKDQSGGLWENIKVLVQALLLAVIIRTLFFQPFSIPSGSMMSKRCWWAIICSCRNIPMVTPSTRSRSRRTCFPAGSGAASRNVAMSPCSACPATPRLDYIKRVVGLPGDRIQVTDGQLFINGEAVKRELVGSYTPEGRYSQSTDVPVYRETLPNGVSYTTLDLTPNSPGDNTREFVVPEGHYFMMGDNRDNSQDSRFDVGYVPLENFIGRGNDHLLLDRRGRIAAGDLEMADRSAA